MRRLLTFAVLLTLALAIPAASGARSSGPNDGTLSIKDARGLYTISARGGVIGSFVQGRVTIVDPVEGDGTGPVVTGDEWSKTRDATTTTWGGNKVRFRLIGGAFRIRVQGRGIFLSLVGKGSVTLSGAGTGNNGMYSANGEPYTAIPDFPFSFILSATSP
jgi:hypothetical protein